MAFNAGDIQATLTLDRTPFQRGLDEAKSEAARFQAEKFKATLDVDNTRAKAKIDETRVSAERLAAAASVRIDADTTAYDAKIEAAHAAADRLAATAANVQVGADTAGYDAKMTAAQQQADRLNGARPTITAVANTLAATTDLKAAQAEADRLVRETKFVKLDADKKLLTAKLEQARAELDRLQAKSAVIDVTAQTAEAKAKIAALQAQVASINQQQIKILVDSSDLDQAGQSADSAATRFQQMAGVAAAAFPPVATAIQALPPALALVAAPMLAVSLGMDGIKQAAMGLAGPLSDMQNAISDAFTKGLTPALANIANAFPAVQTGLTGTATALSGIAVQVSQVVGSTPGIAQLQTLFGGINNILGSLGPGIAGFAQNVLDLASTGITALQPLGTVLSSASDAWHQVITTLTESGTAQTAISSLVEAIGGLLNILPSVVQLGVQVMAVIGPPLAAALNIVATVLAPLVNAFGALPGPIQTAIVAAVGLRIAMAALGGSAATAAPALAQTGTNAYRIGTQAQQSATGVGRLQAALGAVRGGLSGVAQTYRDVSAAARTFDTALGQAAASATTRLTGPLQSAINSVGARFASLRDNAAQFGAAAASAASSAVAALRAVPGAIGAAFSAAFGAVRTAISATASAIAAIPAAAGAAGSAIAGAFTSAVAGVRTAMSTVSSAVASAFTAASAAVRAFPAAVSSAFTTAASATAAFGRAIGAGVTAAFTATVSAARAAGSAISTGFTTGLNAAVTGLRNLGPAAVSAAQAIGTGLRTGLTTAAQAAAAFPGQVRTVISTGLNAIPAAVGSVTSSVASGLGRLGSSITSGVGSALGALPRAIQGVVTGLSRLGTTAAALGTSAFAGLRNALLGTQVQMNGMQTRVGGLIGALGGPWGLAITGAMIGLQLFGQAQQKAAQETLANKQAVQQYADALRDSGGAITSNVTDLAAHAAQTAGAFDEANKLGISTRDVTRAILGQGTASDDLKTKLQGIVDAHTTLIAGEDDTATGLNATNKIMDEQGTTALNLLNDLTTLGTQYTVAKIAAQQLSQATGDATKAFQATGEAASASVSQVALWAQAYNTLADNTKLASQQAGALSAAFASASDGPITLAKGIQEANDALRALDDASKDLPANLVDISGAIDTTTEAGSKFQTAILGASKAMADQYGAAVTAKQGTESLAQATVEAGAQAAQYRQKVIDEAAAHGVNRDAAKAMADQLLQIPKEVTTQISQPGMVQAAANALGLKDQIDSIPNDKSIIVNSLTDEAKTELEALGLKVVTLPNGKIMVTADASQADAEIARAKTAAASGEVLIPVGINAAGYNEGLHDSVGAALTTQGANIPVGANPSGFNQDVHTAKESAAATPAVVPIDGNSALFNGKVIAGVAQANGSVGTITIDGNPTSANGKTTAAVVFANGSRGTITIDGNQAPANGKISATVTYADGSRGTILVDANTGGANSAIDYAARPRYTTITVTEVYGGSYSPADVRAAHGGAGGGIVGFAGGGIVPGRPVHMATGGILPGYAPGTDNIPAILSPGEAVLVPELVRMLGPANILAANLAASHGRKATFWNGGRVRGGDGGALDGAALAAIGSRTSSDRSGALLAELRALRAVVANLQARGGAQITNNYFTESAVSQADATVRAQRRQAALGLFD